MSYSVEYISTFHADVAAIQDWLAEHPKKAARIFHKSDKILRTLKEMPELYPTYRDRPAFRFIVVEDYIIFYKVKHEDKTVEVHRMIYSRMDIVNRLKV